MAVTRFKEDELYPSEIHINQNLGGGSNFGLANWVERDDNIENTDVVVWPCEFPRPQCVRRLTIRLRCFPH